VVSVAITSDAVGPGDAPFRASDARYGGLRFSDLNGDGRDDMFYWSDARKRYGPSAPLT